MRVVLFRAIGLLSVVQAQTLYFLLLLLPAVAAVARLLRQPVLEQMVVLAVVRQVHPLEVHHAQVAQERQVKVTMAEQAQSLTMVAMAVAVAAVNPLLAQMR